MSKELQCPTPLRRFRLIETSEGAEMKADPHGAYVLYADLASFSSEIRETVKYVRWPDLDKRINNGDDFAGDAWVRWTAVGHKPEGAE